MAQNFAYDQDIINLIGDNAVLKFGNNSACVPATETTLVSFTLTADSIIKGVYGEGGTDGLFKLYVNTVAKWQGRNAWTQRIVTTPIELSLVTGDIVELKVTNQKTTNNPFSGGFYVYEL